MEVYLDWGIRKPHVVLLPDGKTYRVKTIGDMEELLVKSSEVVKSGKILIFTEAGIPHNFVYQLIQKGYGVYICRTKTTKEFRGNRGKNDEADARLLKEIHQIQPDAFRQLMEPEQRESELKYHMGCYLHFMKACISFKNKQQAFEREFGEKEAYSEVIKILKAKKSDALKKVKPLIIKELNKVKDIKGIGLCLLAGLLATAHPKRFQSLSKYLAYCGYKESSWQRGKGNYNRLAKSFAWQITNSIIRHRDTKFYPLYLKFKKDLKEKDPNYENGRIHGMAMNRVSTFLLKELYRKFAS
jgi:predicted RNA-binding protein YlxR (DUF448 family)